MNPADDTAWEAELGGYRLIFGPGSIDRVGEVVREIGGTRVLLVTDPGVRDAGHAEHASASIRSAGATPFVFDGVAQNPTTRHVAHGVEAAGEHGIDCILGLGGGSAMDCAKAINFIVTNGGLMEDYWGTGKASRPMLPSIGVPTTAGTGAEAQSYALISQEHSGVKMACGDKKAMFRRVVLDPRLAASVPRAVAGIAGIDALSHAVESYVTTRRNPVSQLFAREAWRRLESSYPRVLTDSDDLRAWSEMLLGAHLAGAAIEQSMLGAAHACANPLTARFPIPHGIAVGLMLPHVVRFNTERVGALYDELRLAGGPTRPAGPLAERIVELRGLGGLPTSLSEVRVPEDCLPQLAAEAATQWTAGFNPRPVSRDELLGLYEAAYA